MQRSPFYGELHRISESADGKRSEILLEWSSAAWGGYEAILLIDTSIGARCYSYLPVRSKDKETQEHPMERRAYARLLQAMVEQGLWEAQDNFDSHVMDGTTYFLTVAHDQREKHLTIHGPVFAEHVDPVLREEQEATRIHAKIIRLIQDFAVGLRSSAGEVGTGKIKGGDLERTPDGKFTLTFRIKEVADTGTLILDNNTSIQLVGIKHSHFAEAVSFIRKLVSNRRIALVSDSTAKEQGYYYAYLLGTEDMDLPFEISKSSPEMRGFLDLKVGLNIAKGMIPNLNTILLRAGYAEVDRAYPFEHLSYFERCEDEAKRDGKGLWTRSSWGVSPSVHQEMIRLAREKAAESKIPIEDCTVMVVREAQSGSWAVEFRPVRRDQFGGGGKFWFMVEGDRVAFDKMELWE